ncbi:S-adenosylmethionine:tRNA ribosyltransferase-isomerase [Actinomadura sp. WAC 06369]|uniref:S-adenosylmethionine:tRNA ribosyltransferase-isomerase n=1 Tax=Actinomadura sp. WAC 06369 TaxID=2203193 RepID=UPI000F7876D6|nr:S-adenosylmethionine:tRNA ribosyltransferase-isomerase [Actinomadura sp. WAC 06369]RSN70171.1 queuosine biosynthesis protein [Actinomadura sp. WAC 06369]
MTTVPETADFAVPPGLEAREPPEARGRPRDGVRLLVGRRATGEVSHHAFRDLPGLLRPGDLLVVNTAATLPAAVRLDRIGVHFSTPVPDAADRLWLVELRRLTGTTTRPYPGGSPGEWIPLPGGATLTLVDRRTDRLWRARLDTDVVPYLRRHGTPVRYGAVPHDQPIAAYQTVFAHDPSSGGAAMPGAARPFTADLVTRLVSRGVLLAPITLHAGAALVRHVRAEGGRVIAVGTTAVRALETAAASGRVEASEGWTDRVVTPESGVRAVDGLLTGLHGPRSPHLAALAAIAGHSLVNSVYRAALDERYLFREFGDSHLLLP